MLNEDILKKIEELANNVCNEVGCYLYDVELSGIGQGRTLRITIDKDEGGVGIEECATVARGINEALDADDIVPGESYHLEVSSPGVDKILKKPWHFQKVVGKKINIRLKQALSAFGGTEPGLASAKQLYEELSFADESGIKLKIKKEEINIPYSAIDKAKLYFEFGPTPKKGKK